MRLDLVIPTLRRAYLLKQALESVANALPPHRMQVGVIVVNNATDPELPGLESVLASIPFETRVLHEPRPGKSAALNAAIEASDADYLGFIDDDEELAADWFRVVEEALGAGPIDFLGGRVLIRPGTEFPDWVPEGYPAVLGIADGGPDPQPYGPEFPGMLKGGNAVISKTMLRTVGPYRTDLGPTADRRLLSCEDEDMYLRLIRAGAQGRYLPHLLVYHCVHPERLRKNYHRAWAFWQGASLSVLARDGRAGFPEIAQVPRYAYGAAARGVVDYVRLTLSRDESRRMAAELPLWNLAGRLYGRHVLSRSRKRSRT
jgi:glycosyltransferase involved in cell wall biosynthesis